MTHATIARIVGLVFLIGCDGPAKDMPDAGAPTPRGAEQVATPLTPAPAPASTVHGPRSTAPTREEDANATGAATKQFLDRVHEYLQFHNRVEQTVPALRETPAPEEIAKREQALGQALIKARPDAKEGDFFIESYRPVLRRLIQEDFATRPAADRKALIVELPKGLVVGVNTLYPTMLPLATFPANLLQILPELPPELEYRMVGRDLILLDVKGNVVVDVMRNAFPTAS